MKPLPHANGRRGPWHVRILRSQLDDRIGAGFIAFATFGLASAWLMLGNPQAPQLAGGGALVAVLLLMVAAASLIAIALPRRPAMWLGPMLFWAALALIGSAQFVRSPGMISAVEPVESVAVLFGTATVGRQGRPPAADRLAVAVAALMLLLFGAIHILEASALSQLVPGWMPLRGQVPYFTGSILIASGLAFGSGRARRIAAFAVALIFLSWLPLVHVERLLRSPEIFEEWRFALTALALAGTLLLIAGKRHKAESLAAGDPL